MKTLLRTVLLVLGFTLVMYLCSPPGEVSHNRPRGDTIVGLTLEQWEDIYYITGSFPYSCTYY